MAYSYVTSTGDGSTRQYTVSFLFIKKRTSTCMAMPWKSLKKVLRGSLTQNQTEERLRIRGRHSHSPH